MIDPISIIIISTLGISNLIVGFFLKRLKNKSDLLACKLDRYEQIVPKEQIIPNDPSGSPTRNGNCIGYINPKEDRKYVIVNNMNSTLGH